MRYWITSLLLIANVMALETKDVVGMWKGRFVEMEGSQVEISFGQDGQMEMRASGNMFGLANFRLNGFGLWAVKGESIDTKSSGGWIAFDDDPAEALDVDTEFVPNPTVIIPGNPRKMRITDCDSPDECVTQELEYVGAAKQFTLPPVSDNTSIKRLAGKVEIRRTPAGKVSMRVKVGGRSFDLTGRSAPAPALR